MKHYEIKYKSADGYYNQLIRLKSKSRPDAKKHFSKITFKKLLNANPLIKLDLTECNNLSIVLIESITKQRKTVVDFRIKLISYRTIEVKL